MVISDYSYEPSHYSCIRSLGDWLSSQGIPGIYGVDTRAITKVIRESGSMLGKLVVQGSTPSANLEIDDPNYRNLVAGGLKKGEGSLRACESADKTSSCLGRGLRYEEQHHQAQQLTLCISLSVAMLLTCGSHALIHSRRQYMQPMTVESQQHDQWAINFAGFK